MIDKAKALTNKVRSLANLSKKIEISTEDVKDAREYIDNYWEKLKRFHPKDDESLMGLPKPYLVPSYDPNNEFDFNELYYWDSYFMVQGLLDEENKELVLGILQNLLSLQKKFRSIPNASRTYLTGRSQPPFLTSFIFDVYDAYRLDNKWLKTVIDIAQDEYFTVWMGSKKPNARRVYKDLSRYYDINMLHNLAEAESGWDMTPRFNHKALNYTPVDLNALLYKYETDFERAAKILGQDQEARTWADKAEDRALTMNHLMWSNLKGLYYDYNYKKEKRGNVSSLATFYPMWAGMVSKKQAADLVKALKRFENKGGLATTDVQPLNQMLPGMLPTQWAYPNGWAPLQFIVVKALERYGYHDDAKRLASKWLKTNLDWFNEHGIFLEKYNVVNPDKPPVKGLYPSQTGFGWTNSIFERFCQDYLDD